MRTEMEIKVNKMKGWNNIRLTTQTREVNAGTQILTIKSEPYPNIQAAIISKNRAYARETKLMLLECPGIMGGFVAGIDYLINGISQNNLGKAALGVAALGAAAILFKLALEGHERQGLIDKQVEMLKEVQSSEENAS